MPLDRGRGGRRCALDRQLGGEAAPGKQYRLLAPPRSLPRYRGVAAICIVQWTRNLLVQRVKVPPLAALSMRSREMLKSFGSRSAKRCRPLTISATPTLSAQNSGPPLIDGQP